MRWIRVLIFTVAVAATSGNAWGFYDASTPAYSYLYAPSYHSGLSNCDDCSAVVDLPWAFNFYGQDYTQITIGSNGYITLGANTSGYSQYGNYPLSWDGTSSAPAPLIAPFWDDLNPSAGGSIYYGQAGGAFIIEWWYVYHYGGSDGMTFEIKLFPDGRIEFHYRDTDGGHAYYNQGAGATVGIQQGSTSIGHPVSYNSASIPSYTAKGLAPWGTGTFYVKATDGFTGQNRPGAQFRQSFYCDGAYVFYNTEPTTRSDGQWAVSATSPCANPTPLMGYWGVAFPVLFGDSGGYDIATIPGTAQDLQVLGSTVILRRSDLTPQPVAAPTWPVTYGAADPNTTTSTLVYYQGGDAIDKPLVVIPGFDPLDEVNTAENLILLGDLAAQLLSEGYDIAIGEVGNPNLRAGWYVYEAGTWVNDAYQRNGYQPVLAAGPSMGGAILRNGLSWGWVHSWELSAWFSIDAPQTGANLGRGDRGLQNLLLCNKSSSDPQYQQIFSAPAQDMMNVRVTTCYCDDEPENSHCDYSSQYSDYYYGTFGWPTQIDRYAVAFGDANPSGGYAKQGSGDLYDFEYSGMFCSEDRDWYGGQLDCNAGSKYIVAADVNADESAGFCGTFRLRLDYEPSFIPVASALGIETALTSTVQDGACSSNFPTLAPTYWTDWASNDYNELHTVISAPLVQQMMTWIHNYTL